VTKKLYTFAFAFAFIFVFTFEMETNKDEYKKTSSYQKERQTKIERKKH
jgi:hypothetical protein